jgi:hypothetical protein
MGIGVGWIGVVEIARVFTMRIRVGRGVVWLCWGVMGGGIRSLFGVAGRWSILVGYEW